MTNDKDERYRKRDKGKGMRNEKRHRWLISVPNFTITAQTLDYVSFLYQGENGDKE